MESVVAVSEVLGVSLTETEERREKRRRLGEEEASESDSEDMEALLGRWATVQKAGLQNCTPFETLCAATEGLKIHKGTVLAAAAKLPLLCLKKSTCRLGAGFG